MLLAPNWAEIVVGVAVLIQENHNEQEKQL